ncbi:SAM-dependent methyltransferase [Paenibacillus agricola]|uniref:Tetratricopeptide repeat protein n=1 Tax=Paenibacillus agricola TaxID=2716264 RepID=A0ABX0J7D9_9BACL|nr:SAM-dependent methyltransferase [Paenibacillus agricola]NHN31716.1 tetratricopeptide repeat protein [Paenibacillus agricola]
MTNNEKPVYRFSEAPIWELQRAYYEEQGIQAWQREEVPQYITSNPAIATSYAEMIMGFLQDRARLGYTSEPVTIVELGAGSGRLAFHILKELSELMDYAGIELPPFCYVMSDLAMANVAYWQQHPSLKPFAQQGVLDFAQFDAVHDTELSLKQAGTRIGVGDLQQPLLVIANYFFDSIPQELLYVDEGQIYECDISLEFPAGAADLKPAELLGQVIPAYHYRRAAEYEQESYPYREVIKLYQQKLEDSHVLFPAVGLSCLARLGRLSQAGFVLLTADKGDHRLENWEFANAPKLIHHGSFSLEANYHAIQHVMQQQGALTLFTKHHYRNLNVGCILMLQQPMGYANTRLAYRRFVERFGPDDFFNLKAWFEEYCDQLELPQLYAFWRLSGYDAQTFLRSAKRFIELLLAGNEHQIEDIRNGMHVMWEGYYPMQEDYDLALDCATVLYQIDMFDDALFFFEHSLFSGFGQDPATLYSMAICFYEVGKEESAAEYANHALAMDPEHEGALALLALMQG